MFKYLRKKLEKYIDTRIAEHLSSYATHKQAGDELREASNITKDLVLAYLAFVDLHLFALERLLSEKSIIISREEIENKVQASMNDGTFEKHFFTYDKLIPLFHKRVMDLRRTGTIER